MSEVSRGPRSTRSRQICPMCSSVLSAKDAKRTSQYLDKCPSCGASIIPIWWQRVLVAGLALLISFSIPAFLGLGKGVTLVFPAVLLSFPALLLAQILVFTAMQPRYVLKNENTLSLFRR
jgi:hypothetical protein